jgi:acetyl-CoA carboxylase carboxyl transferase subunit alpha
LWADPKKAEVAANSLDIGPHKALELQVIDGIVSESSGGAHKDPEATYEMVKKSLEKEVKSLLKLSTKKLLENRFQKFRKIGNHTIALEGESDLQVYQ